MREQPLPQQPHQKLSKGRLVPKGLAAACLAAMRQGHLKEWWLKSYARVRGATSCLRGQPTPDDRHAKRKAFQKGASERGEEKGRRKEGGRPADQACQKQTKRQGQHKPDTALVQLDGPKRPRRPAGEAGTQRVAAWHAWPSRALLETARGRPTTQPAAYL